MRIESNFITSSQDDFDLASLRSEKRPVVSGYDHIKVIDLFSGCGGLTVGALQAAASLGLNIQVLLSCETSQIYNEIYKENFSPIRTIERPIEEILSSFTGEALNAAELELLALQQNLWVNFGSGSFPSVWNRVICSNSKLR